MSPPPDVQDANRSADRQLGDVVLGSKLAQNCNTLGRAGRLFSGSGTPTLSLSAAAGVIGNDIDPESDPMRQSLLPDRRLAH